MTGIDERGQNTTGFIPELTGLRGVAALLIVINHITLVLPALNDIVLPWGTKLSYYTWLCGIAGMSLFFILSGIVIYYTYAGRILSTPLTGIKNFFVARFARLYPLYFVFIVVFFIWNLRLAPELLAPNLTSLPLFLAGMQSWIYGYIDGIEVLYLQGNANITWSVSTEFALYFFFVPFVFAVGRADLKKSLLLFSVAFILGIAFIYSVCYFPELTEWMSSIYPGHGSAHYVYLTYHSPYGRIFEFVTGWAVAMLYLERNKLSRLFRYLSCLAWFGSAALLVLSGGNVFDGWSHTFVSPCLMLFCFGLPYFGSRILRCKPLMFLGDVSYSAYLLHIVFVALLQYKGSDSSRILMTMSKFVGFTYLAAWISYRWFETPVRRKIRSLAR